MKINSQLLEYATKGAEHGMPPLADSLQAFGLHSSCCWFQLNGGAEETDEQLIEISLDGPTFAFPNASNGRLYGPLSAAQIQTIASESHPVFWKDPVDIIRSLRTDAGSGMRHPFFIGYKPFHLILSGERTDI
jgi:hypothetical protein